MCWAHDRFVGGVKARRPRRNAHQYNTSVAKGISRGGRVKFYASYFRLFGGVGGTVLLIFGTGIVKKLALISPENMLYWDRYVRGVPAIGMFTDGLFYANCS